MQHVRRKQDSLFLPDKIISVHMHILFGRVLLLLLLLWGFCSCCCSCCCCCFHLHRWNLFKARNRHFSLKSWTLFSGVAPPSGWSSHTLRSGSQVRQLYFHPTPPPEQAILSLQLCRSGPQRAADVSFSLTFSPCVFVSSCCKKIPCGLFSQHGNEGLPPWANINWTSQMLNQTALQWVEPH